MSQKYFSFHNQDLLQNYRRKESLSESIIRKLIIFSSLFVVVGLLMFKVVWFVYGVWTTDKLTVAQKPLQDSHVFPLLVNLKGDKGPQLARIHVYVTLSEGTHKKEFLPQDSELEKQLLFILSGQSFKMLKKKKDYFEDQIRSQLNAFLTQKPVNGVYIKTEILN